MNEHPLPPRAEQRHDSKLPPRLPRIQREEQPEGRCPHERAHNEEYLRILRKPGERARHVGVTLIEIMEHTAVPGFLHLRLERLYAAVAEHKGVHAGVFCNAVAQDRLITLVFVPADRRRVFLRNSSGRDENGVVRKRDFFDGMCVYAEDIRSPFNIGSIFRTAEAMGADKVFISPRCIDPTQPRAIRSGMGCIETMGWERLDLENLPADLPVFALETGGTDINEFVFPKKGICIIGSEELGVSPDALKKATYGHVTIPMKGLKASLNVGVAFGILMQKWVEAISKDMSKE